MKRMTYRTRRIAVLVVAAALFLGLNLAATAYLTSSRIDLTENHLYTLSDGTRKILKNLPEPITLTLYFSNKTSTAYPYLKNYGQRIRDLLEEYAALSNGKLNLTVIDPEPFSAEEDKAVAAGLKAVQTPTGEQLYLGLAGSAKGAAPQTIAFFARERETFLEYDLTKLIDQLAHPKRPVVDVITSLPMQFGSGGIMAAMRGQAKPFAIYKELQDAYDVRPLAGPFTSIAADVDMLFIAHPEKLGEDQLYAIDQFVLRGGRALIFVDPYLESAGFSAGQQQGQVQPSSDLGKLFSAWGIAMNPGKVIADRALAQKVGLINQSGMRETKDYLPWLAVTEDYMDDKDPVTAELSSVNLASAGAISHDPAATTHFTSLIESSKDAELLDATALMLTPDPDALLNKFKPTGKSYVIAARLTGPASSAFTAPPKDEKSGSKLPPFLARSKAGINVIVVSDADMLEDRFWVQEGDFFGQHIVSPIADNGAFVINAADNLSGSSDLISLRSRGVSNRPFTVVENIRKHAEGVFLAEEQRLEAKLKVTQKRMQALEANQGQGASSKLDANKAAEIESFRQEMLKTRRELREVQHRMRQDIESLGSWLKFINIGLIPLLIILFGFTSAYIRYRRRRN